jgi:type IV secretory pathway TrbD component
MKSPIRRSLLRRISWFGGDRRLVGFSGLLLFALMWTMFVGFGMLFGLTIILPVAMFTAILWVARTANDADPWMIDVMLRQFKYRKYYAPRSDLGTEHPIVRDFVD